MSYWLFVVLIVSTGNTSRSVFLAIANLPCCPSEDTALQPPNSVISFTLPASTPVVAPTSSILLTLVLFWIALGNSWSFSFNSSSPAFTCGAVYTWFAASSLVVFGAVELASTARFLRDFGLLLSIVAVSSAGFVVATDVVDGSSAFTVVCSLFSTLFASVVEVVDDTAGAGVASAGFEVVASAWTFETVDDSTDVELASTGVGVVVPAWAFGAVESLAPEFSSNWLFAGVAARAGSVAVTFGSAAYTAPFPKNMKNAATATLAAPKLTFLTE